MPPRPRGAGHTGGAWRRLRAQKLAPDPLFCWLCGRLMPKVHGEFVYRYPHALSASVHAVIPVSRGGRLTADNTVPAHLKCNRDQGNLLPGETIGSHWIESETP